MLPPLAGGRGNANIVRGHGQEKWRACSAGPRTRRREARRGVRPCAPCSLHRNFRIFWLGAFGSNLGTWLQIVAQGWLVYALTGSPLQLGLVSFANAIPNLLLSLLSGTLADRFERRRLMVITQTAAMVLAFVLAYLTLTGLVQVWHIMLLELPQRHRLQPQHARASVDHLRPGAQRRPAERHCPRFFPVPEQPDDRTGPGWHHHRPGRPRLVLLRQRAELPGGNRRPGGAGGAAPRGAGARGQCDQQHGGGCALRARVADHSHPGGVGGRAQPLRDALCHAHAGIRRRRAASGRGGARSADERGWAGRGGRRADHRLPRPGQQPRPLDAARRCRAGPGVDGFRALAQLRAVAGAASDRGGHVNQLRLAQPGVPADFGGRRDARTGDGGADHRHFRHSAGGLVAGGGRRPPLGRAGNCGGRGAHFLGLHTVDGRAQPDAARPPRRHPRRAQPAALPAAVGGRGEPADLAGPGTRAGVPRRRARCAPRG